MEKMANCKCCGISMPGTKNYTSENWYLWCAKCFSTLAQWHQDFATRAWGALDIVRDDNQLPRWWCNKGIIAELEAFAKKSRCHQCGEVHQ
jgi:hypothetical protein